MDKMFHSQSPIVPHRVPYLVLPAPFCAPTPSFSFSGFTSFAISGKSDSKPDPTPGKDPRPKQKARPGRVEGGGVPKNRVDETDGTVRTTIPKKPRRGRPSEAVLVEDFIRNTLDKTFESVRQTNPELFEAKRNVLKEKKLRSDESVDEDDEEEEKEMAVAEDDPDWPVDAEVGWGVRASKYFEEYPIKNVVGEDGTVIDWDGESEAGYIGEINCLEWESFAYHPSPIIVLVFERYNRAADNWKALKELEKAAKVYWNAENILPPRTVKIDINIERDLAYALKVRDCPQILFLKGNRIVYREKEIRTSDELVQMIAHFYYNAKRPPWVEAASLARRPF